MRGLPAAHAALVELGGGTARQLAVRLGVTEYTARLHLRALETCGSARRTTSGYGLTLPPRRLHGVRLPDQWVALAPPPAALTARDAVVAVLREGPVVGQGEVARRSGYGPAAVAVALAEVAVSEPVGRGWRRRYSLREGL